jgi:hypothetical protein
MKNFKSILFRLLISVIAAVIFSIVVEPYLYLLSELPIRLVLFLLSVIFFISFYNFISPEYAEYHQWVRSIIPEKQPDQPILHPPRRVYWSGTIQLNEGFHWEAVYGTNRRIDRPYAYIGAPTCAFCDAKLTTIVKSYFGLFSRTVWECNCEHLSLFKPTVDVDKSEPRRLCAETIRKALEGDGIDELSNKDFIATESWNPPQSLGRAS